MPYNLTRLHFLQEELRRDRNSDHCVQPWYAHDQADVFGYATISSPDALWMPYRS